MKRIFPILLILVAVSCGQSEDERAALMMLQIDSLFAQEKYHETMDSIVALRARYPKAVASRKKALKIWRAASLHLVQLDIARTDSALQSTLRLIDGEKDLYRANKLRADRDSLQARYEAMCGVVRMIRSKQGKEQ